MAFQRGGMFSMGNARLHIVLKLQHATCYRGFTTLQVALR